MRFERVVVADFDKLTITVVMTTFNGSRYITPQLESLRDQSIPPDEVLIFDDCSTDNTVDIVEEFILANDLSWKVLRNSINLGWRDNFIQGFLKSSGDLIFPCDQDDVWDLEKIKIMVEVISQNKKCSLLVTNYRLLFEKSFQGRRTMPSFSNDLTIYSLPLSAIGRIRRPGCTFCFRKEFLLRIIPFWMKNFTHDGFLWRFAIAERGCYVFNYPTITFRRHDKNNSPKNRRAVKDRLSLYDYYINMFEQIKKYTLTYGYLESAMYSGNLVKFYEIRRDFLLNHSLHDFLQLIKYYRYYESFNDMASDLFIISVDMLKNIISCLRRFLYSYIRRE